MSSAHATTYLAYGLHICSDLPLPELPLTEAGRATDVSITCGSIGWTPPPGDHSDGYVSVAGDTAYIFVEEVGAFAITAGRHIVVDAPPTTSEDLLRVFLLGGALGLLLDQRGYLVLHASAVALEGRVVVFVGSSGEGKSTTAAAMHRRGHPLLADDLVAVDLTGAEPTVYPGFSRVKLTYTAAAALGYDQDALTVFNPEDERRDWRAEPLAPTPLPLQAIIELVSAPATRLLRSSKRGAFTTLLNHAYAVGLTGRSTPAHLHQSVRAAKQIPFYTLERPRDLAMLPDLALQIETAFLPQAAPTPW